MEEITILDLVKAAREVAKEFPENQNRQKGTTFCQHFNEDDTPSCLFGHALRRLGGPERFNHLNCEFELGSAIESTGIFYSSFEEVDFLDRVQESIDSGNSQWRGVVPLLKLWEQQFGQAWVDRDGDY